MTTKIEQYSTAKRWQTTSLAWTSLIGSPYSGGGGGIGKLTSLSLDSVTVYHQYSDGDTNYHEIPFALKGHLCEAIKSRFGELVADALARQDLALKAAAAEAVKEHDELLREAGINSGEQK